MLALSVCWLEIFLFLLKEFVIATFLELGFHSGFLQVILAPKGTKSLNEDRQEGKSSMSQEASHSVGSGPENEQARMWRWSVRVAEPPGLSAKHA